MIRLITGLPGAGKSLRAVQVIRAFLNEGRAVYVQGVDGLQPFGWEPCDAREWESLPDGSVVVVDEAQKVWPSRRSGDPSPDIRALSEHRHRGFDFVLITQNPTMLDAYVRKLVGQHEHVLRQFGLQTSRIVTWTECQDDPQSLGTRQRGTDALWKYPRECFGLYKSATMHTVKRKIPLRIAAIPVLLLLVVFLGWKGYSSVNALASAKPTEVVPTPAGSDRAIGAPGRMRDPEVKYADAAEYAVAFLPRVPAMPWSAPAFDQREVRAEPELYCVKSEAKGCQCYTEQVTRVFIDKASCLRIVAYGSYNPFRAPFAQATAPAVAPGTNAPLSGQPVQRLYEELPVPRNTAEVWREPVNAGSVWPDRHHITAQTSIGQ